MNIHFTDKDLFKELMNSSLLKVEIGSSLYKIDNDDSDKDYLIIYADGLNQEKSFLWQHHQLQFKEDNVDYMFTTVSSFIRNLLTGDSLINFEVIHTKDLISSPLKFLNDQKLTFYNYNILKAHLGFAKRDLKQSLYNNKKLSHAYRTLFFYERIKETLSGGKNIFSLEMKTLYPNEYQKIKKLKSGTYGDISFMVKQLKHQQEKLREQLNHELNHQKIEKIASPHSLKELDLKVMELKNSKEFKEKQSNLDLSSYYEVLSKDISY